MGGLKVFASVLFLVAVAVSGPEQLVSAQTYHVVGGEDGWSSASSISSWLSGRVFRVGDKLCKHAPYFLTTRNICISVKSKSILILELGVKNHFHAYIIFIVMMSRARYLGQYFRSSTKCIF